MILSGTLPYLRVRNEGNYFLMASTYTSKYQIQLIGSGEQAGQWGISTNDNMERLENAIGASYAIDVTSPPAGSTYTGATDAKVLLWIMKETLDAGSDGTEGRCAFVSFGSGVTDVGLNFTIQVRGTSSSEYPERSFIVRNDLYSSQDLMLNFKTGATPKDVGTNYTLKSGRSALVFTTTTAKGTASAFSAANALGLLQLDGVDVSGTSSAKLYVADSQAEALQIHDGTTPHLTVNTSGNSIDIGQGDAIGTISSKGGYGLTLKTGGANAALRISPNGSGDTIVTTGDLTLTSGTLIGNVNTSSHLLSLAPSQVDAPAINIKDDSGIVADGDELSLDLDATGIDGTLDVDDGGTGQGTLGNGEVLIGNGNSGIQSVDISSGDILVGQSGSSDPQSETFSGLFTINTSAVATFTASASLTTPTILDFTNANHDHSNAANGGSIQVAVETSNVQEVTWSTIRTSVGVGLYYTNNSYSAPSLPLLVTFNMKCNSAELGYSVDDIVPYNNVGGFYGAGGDNDGNLMVYEYSGGKFVWHVIGGNFTQTVYVINKAATGVTGQGTISEADVSKWSLVVSSFYA